MICFDAKKTIHVIITAALLLLLCLIYAPSVHAQANEDVVTVYLTVSEDGDFVRGTEGTLLAETPITVEYFDLAEYGLERFEYSGAEGKYPTLLHMFIRITEQYYLGRTMTPEDFAGSAMEVTNNPGSLYLKHFWGHDENLMYFVNHAYPVKAPGIGATCDQIVLEEGDTIDIGMFKDWTFHNSGGFCCFEPESKSMRTGETATFTLEGASTTAGLSGSASSLVPLAGEAIRISSDQGGTWATAAAVTDENGACTFRFTAPGTYYIASGPQHVNYPNAAPAISIIKVTGDANPSEDPAVTFDPDNGTAPTVMTVPRYTQVQKLEDPVREGCTFRGWTLVGGGTGLYDFARAVTRDITLKAKWECSIKDAKVVLSDASFTYNGKIQRPSIKTIGGRALAEGTDYTATWSNPSSKNAGTYTVTIKGKGTYTGKTRATYKIAKARQTLTVKAAKKTLKASKLKKKAVKVSVLTIKKQGGKVKYKKLSGSAKLKVNAKTGKITVKKNTKKGTYKAKVKVTSAASTNYKAASKNVTVKIVVKK